MLKQFVLSNKTKEETEDFLFKLSPFTDKNSKWKNFLTALSMQQSYIEAMGEVDNSSGVTKQKFFLAWYNWNKTILFCGTAFVSQEEFTKGISLSDYEKQASV